MNITVQSEGSVVQWIEHQACFTREGTSTIVVYGKHIFQNNFSLAIMLDWKCFAV